MCIEMFPKNRINIVYRILCLVSFIVTIWVVNSYKTLLIILLAYIFFALSEKSFRNIELIIITLIIIFICYLFKTNFIFKIMLMIDYAFYFLDTSYYLIDKKEKISKNDYLRFASKNKKKGSSNIIALYLTAHLVILFLAIVVGK